MELAKALDLSSYKDRKLRNRVNRIGLELEGIWTTIPKGTMPVRDGSLDPWVRRLQNEGRIQTGMLVGEVPSPPLTFSKEDNLYWKTWIQKFYPQMVSPECGLHIHMSFLTTFTYQRLMRPDYPATVLNRMSEWSAKEGLPKDHPLWPRLQGQSRYCQHKFFADKQALAPGKDYDQNRDGHRYTVINYPFTRNRTIECRLLPMFEDVQQAMRALEEIIRVTNEFLVATAAREPKIAAKADLDGVVVKEEKKDRLVLDAPELYREVRNVRI